MAAGRPAPLSRACRRKSKSPRSFSNSARICRSLLSATSRRPRRRRFSSSSSCTRPSNCCTTSPEAADPREGALGAATAPPRRSASSSRRKSSIWFCSAIPSRLSTWACAGAASAKPSPKTAKRKTEDAFDMLFKRRCRNSAPFPYCTTVTARRFCAQELSSEPSAAG